VLPPMTTEDFQSFAFAHYDRPQVRQAALELQDRHGCDVVLLLFAVWISKRGRRLDEERLKPLVASAHLLQANLIAPLRAARRVACNAGMDSVCQRLRERELAAEVLELKLLAPAIGQFDRSDLEPVELDRVNAGAYLQCMGLGQQAQSAVANVFGAHSRL